MSDLRKLPGRVRVELGKTSHDTKVFDEETGTEVEGIVSLRVEIDARHREMTKVEIVMYPGSLTISGAATYRVDELGLKAIAASFGYTLSKLEPI